MPQFRVWFLPPPLLLPYFGCLSPGACGSCQISFLSTHACAHTKKGAQSIQTCLVFAYFIVLWISFNIDLTDFCFYIFVWIYLKSNTGISHLYKCSDPLFLVLCKVSLAAIPALVLGKSLCTPGIVQFLSVFLAALLKVSQIGWETAIFRSPYRCSMGFNSGLWLGCSRTFRDLSRSHSSIVLAVCFRPLYWKVNHWPSPRSLQQMCTLMLPAPWCSTLGWY